MLSAQVAAAFAGRDVLVTGGTGMIGRQVVDLLCAAGARVTSVSLDELAPHPAAIYRRGDLRSFDFCREVTHGRDFVFHVAGVKGSLEVTRARPASPFVTLLMINTNVLEACRVNGVQKVVYTSSIGAYASGEVFREGEGDDGPPMDYYPGWAKRMGEFQIEAYRLQYGLEHFAVVRPCNVYGPGDSFEPDSAMVIPSLMWRIRHGEDPLVVWGDGSAVRDFAYSRDVAEGVVLALHHGTGGGYVNLAGGSGVTIRELVETLHGVLGVRYRFDPTRPAGFPKRVMDVSLARRLLGWAPRTSLGAGLEATWAWYVAHEDEHLQKANVFREAAA